MNSPTTADVPWENIWHSVASELSDGWARGLERFVTEDVLRFATVKAIAQQGIAPAHLETEWRRFGVRDSVDLALLHEPKAAIEFKYPREPRESNAAWTQHAGETIKDFYRLAYMPPEFAERWAVQLVTPRFDRYISNFQERYGIRLAMHPGHTTILEPAAVRALPATATRILDRWIGEPHTVRANCVAEYQVADLRLLVHRVVAVELSGV